MKPAPGLQVEWVDDECVVLNSVTGEIHYLNATAAFVYGLITEIGHDAAMERIEKSYGHVENMRQELAKLISDLVEKGLLVDA